MSWLTSLALQKKIGLLFLSGLIPGLALFSWVGVRSLNESTDRILEQRLTIARIVAGHLDETLSHVLLHLQDAARQGGERPSKLELGLMAEDMHQIFGASDISVRGIILADRNGRVLRVEPPAPGVVGSDISVRAEVIQTLNTGQPAVSNLATGLPAVPEGLLAVAPVLSGSGEVVGVLAASIEIGQASIRNLSQIAQVGATGYVEIVDGNGIVLARTDPDLPPKLAEKSDHPGRFAELIRQGKSTVSTCHRCHETEQQKVQRRRDVLAFAPLSGASWGIAIRQSEDEALAPTRLLESRFLLVGIVVLIVTLAFLWLMMQGVVRPVRMLTAAAKRVAAGDFGALVPVGQQDEIGELSTAFSSMTRELARSRDDLVSRNQELSALNTLAATMGQSLDLKEVLDSALDKVLEVTRTAAGCVFLKDQETGRLEFVNGSGLSGAFRCHWAGSTEAGCACYRVMAQGQALMVNDPSQCPALSGEAMVRENIGCFVSVPLQSKSVTLGIMNIACTAERAFTSDDFRLLDSIGHQIGLAIENSVLYREARQKEKQRGQLLKSVIGAQEEERKRIARELHDEYGQTLTGLILTIESLQNVTSPDQPQIRDRLQSARAIVVHALEDVRKLVLDLRPPTLDHLGLAATIGFYARTHLEDRGVQVDIKTSGLNGRLPPLLETALFRIVQEATNNIAKYAQAHTVRITVENKDGRIEAVVEDDGMGFDVDAFRSRVGSTSLGLIGIEERATLLGGTFSVWSHPGRGTRVTVRIPVEGNPA